jgi:hypothetical protein
MAQRAPVSVICEPQQIIRHKNRNRKKSLISGRFDIGNISPSAM